MKLCTAEQMRRIDASAVSEFGTPTLLLMENAGRAVAVRLWELTGENPDARVLVLCGRGNNGGDGFVAARHLFNRGQDVSCLLAGDPAQMHGDARTNYDLALRLGVPIATYEGGAGSLTLDDVRSRIQEADYLVDALLGTGFRGEPREPVSGLLRELRERNGLLLAVDLPSGMDADTGWGDAAPIADVTVTFGLPKLGLALRRNHKELTVANISLPRALLVDEELQTEWIVAERAQRLWPPRGWDEHKGDRGRLFVLAGSVGMTGAATLCCEAALRSGTGLVTLGIPSSLNDAMEVKLTEAMTLPLPELDSRAHGPDSLERVRERLAGSTALALGPGFGRDPRSGELVRAVLADCPVPVVVDADGLFLVSPADGQTFPSRCVITPHEGEIARLLGTSPHAVKSNRVETVREAALRFGCVVVLKGPVTLVAAPDGRLGVNSSGSRALATGGTGDVLTGMVAACLARGLDPYEAAVAGVFLHGVAGEVAGQRFGAAGTVAGDVVAAIPEARGRLYAGEIPLPCRIV